MDLPAYFDVFRSMPRVSRSTLVIRDVDESCDAGPLAHHVTPNDLGLANKNHLLLVL